MKLNTTKTFTFLLALFLTVLVGTLWSCTNEEIGISITGNDESTVAFTVKIPSGGIPKLSTPTTYALSVEDENEVSQIAVLFFDTDGKYTYQPIYVSGSNITSAGQVKTFTVKIPQGTYDAVVLGNSNISLSNIIGTITKGQDKTTVLNKLLVTNSEKWNATAGSADYKPIPMWGEEKIEATNGSTINVSFKLTRMLAKIDVTLTTSAAKEVFSLESVRLYNYNNQGQIVPTAANWDNSSSVVTNPSIPSTAQRAASPLVYDDKAIAKDEASRGVSCMNEIYTFEAAAGEYASLATNTCLVIGGTYTGDSKTIYYRIDFANTSGVGDGASTAYLPLLRNHNYKVNITNIRGYGFASPEDAFEAGPINIEASVLNWNDAQITEIAYDGQHMLGVSTSEFTFTREGRTDSSTDNILSITTDSPSGWKVENIFYDTGGSASWLNLSSTNGDSNVTSSSKLLLSENTTDSDRTGFIQLSAGNLTFMIKVQQLAKAKDILITNKEGEPITTLEFASKKDVKPLAQEFNVSWPETLTLSYINTPIGNPFLFDTGVGFESIPANESITNSTGEKTYTIRPPAITTKQLAENPFYERNSTILYSIPDRNAVINKMVRLRQYVPIIIPTVKDFYKMDGGRKSFYVRSNTPFTVSIKPGTNSDGVVTLITTEGDANTSASGTRVDFDIIDDMTKLTLLQRDVVLTFKSATNLFTEVDVTLNCVSAIVQPESNAYMVTPNGGGILIPVSRANASDLLLQPQLSSDDTFTAELLWTDNKNRIAPNSNIKIISEEGVGSSGYVVVVPGSAQGNAVVAIKNKAGKILWSWHIWVTDYSPVPIGEGGFMDRNLGAIGNTPGTVGIKGLLYQWGRKDPFPGSDAVIRGGEPILYCNTDSNPSIVKTAVNEGNNLANSVANPTTFYFNSVAPFDWYTNNMGGQNNTLWNDNPVKSVYDPCPEGWRIPRGNVWDDLEDHYNNFVWISESLGRFNTAHGGFILWQVIVITIQVISGLSVQLVTIGRLPLWILQPISFVIIKSVQVRVTFINVQMGFQLVAFKISNDVNQ